MESKSNNISKKRRRQHDVLSSDEDDSDDENVNDKVTDSTKTDDSDNHHKIRKTSPGLGLPRFVLPNIQQASGVESKKNKEPSILSSDDEDEDKDEETDETKLPSLLPRSVHDSLINTVDRETITPLSSKASSHNSIATVEIKQVVFKAPVNVKSVPITKSNDDLVLEMPDDVEAKEKDEKEKEAKVSNDDVESMEEHKDEEKEQDIESEAGDDVEDNEPTEDQDEKDRTEEKEKAKAKDPEKDDNGKTSKSKKRKRTSSKKSKTGSSKRERKGTKRKHSSKKPKSKTSRKSNKPSSKKPKTTKSKKKIQQSSRAHKKSKTRKRDSDSDESESSNGESSHSDSEESDHPVIYSGKPVPGSEKGSGSGANVKMPRTKKPKKRPWFIPDLPPDPEKKKRIYLRALAETMDFNEVRDNNPHLNLKLDPRLDPKKWISVDASMLEDASQMAPEKILALTERERRRWQTDTSASREKVPGSGSGSSGIMDTSNNNNISVLPPGDFIDPLEAESEQLARCYQHEINNKVAQLTLRSTYEVMTQDPRTRDHCPGDDYREMAYRLLDTFKQERSADQVDVHKAILQTCEPQIYKEDLASRRRELLELHERQSFAMAALVSTPRRWGKTMATGIIVTLHYIVIVWLCLVRFIACCCK